jgi:hypothetical protein
LISIVNRVMGLVPKAWAVGSSRAFSLPKLAHHDGHFRQKIGDPKMRFPLFDRGPFWVINGPAGLKIRLPLHP